MRTSLKLRSSIETSFRPDIGWRLAGGSRSTLQSKNPLSAAGANKARVKIDDRLRRLANFTYLARVYDAITSRKNGLVHEISTAFD
jgi:hypothetical protein